jgi:hypothetical protein
MGAITPRIAPLAQVSAALLAILRMSYFNHDKKCFIYCITDKSPEKLCARYSWKLTGFGCAKPVCNWSDTRAAVPIEDMKSAYYGHSVVESCVWINGVVGLEVGVE